MLLDMGSAVTLISEDVWKLNNDSHRLESPIQRIVTASGVNSASGVNWPGRAVYNVD